MALRFATAESGIGADTVNYPGLDAFVFVDAGNADRFPPVAGSALSAAEVKSLMKSALTVNRSRTNSDASLDSQARVTISVVDTNGEVLAIGAYSRRAGIRRGCRCKNRTRYLHVVFRCCIDCLLLFRTPSIWMHRRRHLRSPVILGVI